MLYLTKIFTEGVFVANIIPIDGKLNLLKNRKDALIRQRKIKAVQNVFRCVRCAFKCEKCGVNLDQGHEPANQTANGEIFNIPYHFCNNCREEYQDYLKYLRGEIDPENYWHSNNWAELWNKWIVYQGALDSYLKSKEFKSLLGELKGKCPGNEEV
jgi:hypothetical protein